MTGNIVVPAASQATTGVPDKYKRKLRTSSHVRVPHFAWPALALTILIAIWQSATYIFNPPGWLVPSPVAILGAMITWSDDLPRHIAATLFTTLAGFVFAAAVGIPMAVLIVCSTILKRTIYPLLLALQSMPKIALAPLLLMWVGHGLLSKIIIVFIGALFPIIISTTAGLEKTPRLMMDLAASCVSRPVQTFLKIRLPYALPYIFVGLKVGATLAVIGAVIGEFVGSEQGLGYLILISTSQFDSALAFAAMLFLMIISVALYQLIEHCEARFAPWSLRIQS